MSPRFIPVLFVAAALAFACGPRSHSSEPTAHKRAAAGPPIASSLEVNVKKRVDFALRVTNNASKRLELTFPNGHTHEIVVLNEAGSEVWRWSEGRIFTQALQNKVLETNETLSYEASWSPESEHGTFVAVASLRSENHPVEQRVAFTLP